MNDMDELIKELRERRETLRADMEARLRDEKGEVRSLTDDEQAAFDGVVAEVKAIDSRITDLQAAQEREDAATAASAKRGTNASIKIGQEPLTYEKGSRNSYVKDMVSRAANHADAATHERLASHAREVEVELRDVSRTDGGIGEFVPPLWLLDEYAALARAARVTADLIGSRPLPAGTDTISVPIVSGGATAVIQTADNASVSETDMTTTSVSAGVKTIAGQQDLSIQLIEQSPMNMDDIVFGDLAADYAMNVDKQVINGSNANGQVKGLLNATGINSVSYTDGTPTVPEAWPKLLDAIQQVAAGRYFPADACILHPRRWFWIMAALDGNSRPYAAAVGPQNAFADTAPMPPAQGAAGHIAGIPVYLDPNVPTTLGGGTEDAAIFIRRADPLLWESSPNTRVLPDVGSGTLTVRFQLYGYIAFTAERYPEAVGKVIGTGLVAPTF